MAKRPRHIFTHTKKGKELWNRILKEAFIRLYKKSKDVNGEEGDFIKLAANSPIIKRDNPKEEYNIDFGGIPLDNWCKYMIKKHILENYLQDYAISIPYLDYEITPKDEYDVYIGIQKDYNMTDGDLVTLKCSCDLGPSPKMTEYDPNYSIMSKMNHGKK